MAGLTSVLVPTLCEQGLFPKGGGVRSSACTTRVPITRGDDCIAVVRRIFLLVCVSLLPNDYPVDIQGKSETDGRRPQAYLFGYR